MEEIVSSIKPLIKSKNSTAGYMFSQSGKGFNKNGAQTEPSSIQQKDEKLKKILYQKPKNEEIHNTKKFKDVDHAFFDSYHNFQFQKKESKRMADSEINKNKHRKHVVEEIHGEVNAEYGDDKYVFYMESDLDKIRGIRQLSYLNREPVAPPIGTYNPKYDLTTKKITSQIDYAATSKMNRFSKYKKRSQVFNSNKSGGFNADKALRENLRNIEENMGKGDQFGGNLSIGKNSLENFRSSEQNSNILKNSGEENFEMLQSKNQSYDALLKHVRPIVSFHRQVGRYILFFIQKKYRDCTPINRNKVVNVFDKKLSKLMNESICHESMSIGERSMIYLKPNPTIKSQ